MSRKIDRLFEDLRNAEQRQSDDAATEVRRVIAQASIANLQRIAARQRTRANRERAKTDAETRLREGRAFPSTAARDFRDSIAKHRRELSDTSRPNESEAMRDRSAKQQRREKLAAIDERFTNFRKGLE